MQQLQKEKRVQSNNSNKCSCFTLCLQIINGVIRHYKKEFSDAIKRTIFSHRIRRTQLYMYLLAPLGVFKFN